MLSVGGKRQNWQHLVTADEQSGMKETARNQEMLSLTVKSSKKKKKKGNPKTTQQQKGLTE